ncbi:MAG TPA: GNAT family N-acetyltransferase [Pseudolabrys sp.]|nr:GNAT family N-acetyltransferase [Pseudolabrys sp.]
MAIVYRPALEQDFAIAEALTVASINDLTERHAFGAMASPGPHPFLSFSLQDDPAGLWVAEEAGKMLGFAFSWVCGDLWFLAQLFISPDRQNQGIGHALITRTMDQARKSGVTTKALITFAFNRASQSLYIRHGIFPKLPLYFFAVTRDALRLPGERLPSTPLSASAAHLRALDTIDVAVLGVSRAKHHRYLLSDAAANGLLFQAANGDCIGYVYVIDGHVGPLAISKQEAAGAALATALAFAADAGAARVSAFIPGSCHGALILALASGMRITFPMLLMADRDFGDWSRYMPRNPGFM